MGRILVFGDSVAYGKWDPEGGWVARVRRHFDETYNIPRAAIVHVFNLGVPSNVAADIAARFEGELKRRMSGEENNLVLITTGINDSCPNNRTNGQRTPHEQFDHALSVMIAVARRNNCAVALIGLLPVDEAKQRSLIFKNEHAATYNTYLEEFCRREHVPFLDLFEQLTNEDFQQHLQDSVHPNAVGHAIIAQRVLSFLTEQGLMAFCLERGKTPLPHTR